VLKNEQKKHTKTRNNYNIWGENGTGMLKKPENTQLCEI